MLADDGGETLIELVLAVAIIAITAVALIGSVLTGISASSEHRTLADGDAIIRSFADAAAQQIQRQTPALWQGCATSYTLDNSKLPSVPTGYQVGFDFNAAPIKYWISAGSGGTWSASNCPSNSAPQLITVVMTPPTQIQETLSFVVRKPT